VNQVSGDEIRAGYRRGRLSSAISKDDGRTWQHFRTLDRVVLPPAGRVQGDPAPRMARALKWVGQLPDDYGAVHYPDFNFYKNFVVLAWYRTIKHPKPGDPVGQRLRIVPLEWFYLDDAPYRPPEPAPELFINKGFFPDKIPSLYCDQRFFVHASDVAKVLGEQIEADMYAPIDQVLAFLGYDPEYDESRMNHPKHPRLTVEVAKSLSE